jgi:hypothetical protein
VKNKAGNSDPVIQGSEVVLYSTKDGRAAMEVRFERDTVWLSQKQMARLFAKNSDTIGLHIRNIYKEKELEAGATTEDSSAVRLEGGRRVTRTVHRINARWMHAGETAKSLVWTRHAVSLQDMPHQELFTVSLVPATLSYGFDSSNPEGAYGDCFFGDVMNHVPTNDNDPAKRSPFRAPSQCLDILLSRTTHLWTAINVSGRFSLFGFWTQTDFSIARTVRNDCPTMLS